jgi:hypothetical protein
MRVRPVSCGDVGNRTHVRTASVPGEVLEDAVRAKIGALRKLPTEEVALGANQLE